jgi:predicted AAA+ superfamily ATPase
MFASDKAVVYFDLENPMDISRMQNPTLMLESLQGNVIIDEIQQMPELFPILRVLVDRPENKIRFLVLGSASPEIIKNVSESLAGRVEFIEINSFNLLETGVETCDALWQRGGFPRSFLAASDEDSMAWREGFIQTFLNRDIPQLGISIAPAAMRRFWMMLAHYHGQTLNASELGRSLGLSDKTVKSYLDILTATFMVRQLQPWHENISKRQVKSPKIYLRDSGILHSLLGLPNLHALFGHPKVGASWEGFALEQALQVLRPSQSFFWATHSGAEIDLFFVLKGKRYGIECKFTEAPTVTKSMMQSLESLGLEHIWIIYPGKESYPISGRISAWPLKKIQQLPSL